MNLEIDFELFLKIVKQNINRETIRLYEAQGEVIGVAGYQHSTLPPRLQKQYDRLQDKVDKLNKIIEAIDEVLE